MRILKIEDTKKIKGNINPWKGIKLKKLVTYAIAPYGVTVNSMFHFEILAKILVAVRLLETLF